MQKKRLDLKDKVNFKIYDATSWLANNNKYILPNISRSKGNQTIKSGQLIIEIFFVKNHAENEARRLVPNDFVF